ncbi:hypothetical protein [Amycolatopsis keratiniphila]|uniref:Uncharacterized protein n=1 Tax=Amycolatopsis keratiniphila subsp. keratiniphila TaxID=227715 RepID=A0A1W2LHN6_9PSEU|nr:hypothetical protein [Amycolatopsis keratiniphila]ONF62264.1 hypothetical protein AVR91_0238535 [Amycolatopsis keratiniphila subsp. keratiniphila]
MTENARGRAALAEKMDDRRAYLRIKWQDVAKRAVLSIATLGRVRSGKGELTTDTKYAIEDALEWERGSIDAILDGGEPTPKPETPPVPAAGGNPRALIAEWTPAEIARVETMSFDEIEAEGRTIGRFSGDDARARYLHDAAVIKLHRAPESTRNTKKSRSLGS